VRHSDQHSPDVGYLHHFVPVCVQGGGDSVTFVIVLAGHQETRGREGGGHGCGRGRTVSLCSRIHDDTGGRVLLLPLNWTAPIGVSRSTAFAPGDVRLVAAEVVRGAGGVRRPAAFARDLADELSIHRGESLRLRASVSASVATYRLLDGPGRLELVHYGERLMLQGLMPIERPIPPEPDREPPRQPAGREPRPRSRRRR
jgi:hypothetical protein